MSDVCFIWQAVSPCGPVILKVCASSRANAIEAFKNQMESPKANSDCIRILESVCKHAGKKNIVEVLTEHPNNSVPSSISGYFNTIPRISY